MEVHVDAFSSGQIGSKIWLCEELEKLGWASKLTWIYGGWFATTAFLLLSRGNLQVNTIRSFDVDPDCQPVADMINENWVIDNWRFKAVTADCGDLKPFFEGVDLIINTSTEHFDNTDWFLNIPKGTRVVLQGNNMPHDDHIATSNTLTEFINQYPLSQYEFTGSKDFVYPAWQFTRYMVIGVK